MMCEEEPLTKPLTLENYPPEKYVGDGKLPNLYWVFADDGYYYLVPEDEGWYLKPCEEIDGEGCYGKGVSLGVFKTFREALRVAENDYHNRVFIEDRISGEIYEAYKYYKAKKGRIYDPETGRVKGEAWVLDKDEEEYETYAMTRFTKEKLEECGYEFE